MVRSWSPERREGMVEVAAAMGKAVVNNKRIDHWVEMRRSNQSTQMSSDELVIRSTLLAARSSKLISRSSLQQFMMHRRKVIPEALFRDVVDSYGNRSMGRFVEGHLSDEAGRRECANGDVYTGEFKHGETSGRGLCRYANGDVYEGQFAQGMRSGEGTLTTGQSSYEGQWHDDLPHGAGTMVWSTASGVQRRRYAGQWRHGKRHGMGAQTWADGRCYEGQWADGEQHGAGRMRWGDGGDRAGAGAEPASAAEGGEEAAGFAREEFMGEWQHNEQQGRGAWRAADGRRFEGQWRDGLAHGDGCLVHGDGGLHEGSFEAGREHGEGRLHYPQGGHLAGTWRCARLEGHGARVWPAAEAGGAALHLEGVWRGGRRLLGAYALRVPAPPAQPRGTGPVRVHIKLLSDGDATVRIDGAPQDKKGERAAREARRAREAKEVRGAREAPRRRNPRGAQPLAGAETGEAGAAAAEEGARLVLERIAWIPAAAPPPSGLPAAAPPHRTGELLPPDAARRPAGAAPLGAMSLGPRRYLPTGLGSPRSAAGGGGGAAGSGGAAIPRDIGEEYWLRAVAAAAEGAEFKVT